MRRIRQTPKGFSAAEVRRLSVAIALSAAVHALLISWISFRPGAGPRPRLSVIEARLASPELVARPPVSIAQTPARAPVVAQPLPPTPAQLQLDTTEPAAASPLVEDPLPQPSAQPVSVPDLVHYPARELDVYPQPLKPVSPVYPHQALAERIGGSVTLMLMIDEVGRVTEAAVVDAAPEGLFDQSAVAALSAAAFSPAQKNGRAVRSRLLITLDFDPAVDPTED